MSVSGRQVNFERGRLVFLGYSDSPEKQDTVYIGFRNVDGEDTKLVLSREAMTALVALYADPNFGEGPCDFPHKMEWAPVSLDTQSIIQSESNA